MKNTLKLITIMVALSATVLSAAEWPWLYGPRRDHTSEQTGLLRAWPQEGPKVLWTVPMGAGFGGPPVSGGNVYLLDRDEKVGDTVGPMGDLHTISTKTRKPAWRKNIWKDFNGGAELPRWAIVQNPLIYGDALIVAPQTPEAGVVAYDKLTGALKWKSAPLSGIPGYVTPSIVKVAGEDHLVMITAAVGRGRTARDGSVNGLDPRSGKLLWTYSGWQCIIPVPQAVDAGEGRVLVTGAYGAGSVMLKVEKNGDDTRRGSRTAHPRMKGRTGDGSRTKIQDAAPSLPRGSRKSRSGITTRRRDLVGRSPDYRFSQQRGSAGERAAKAWASGSVQRRPRRSEYEPHLSNHRALQARDDQHHPDTRDGLPGTFRLLGRRAGDTGPGSRSRGCCVEAVDWLGSFSVSWAAAGRCWLGRVWRSDLSILRESTDLSDGSVETIARSSRLMDGCDGRVTVVPERVVARFSHTITEPDKEALRPLIP